MNVLHTELSYICCLAMVLHAVMLHAGAASRDAAPAFAREFSQNVSELIVSGACIDPTTGNERKAERKQLRKRQRELRRWSAERNDDSESSRPATPQDRANKSDFHRLMANGDLLALPFRSRKGQVESATTYLDDFGRFFPEAWNRVIVVSRPNLLANLERRPTVKAAYFGQAGNGVSSLYSPASCTMYLDLNVLAADPEVFFDSLEHELWHHLLPIVSPDDVGKNIWWEGFNEALAEWWRVEFDRARGAAPPGDAQSVEYPVQVAFASLFLGANREGTLGFLSGTPLPAPPPSAHPDSLDLRQLWANACSVSPAEQQRIEAILTAWRWKEDDGGPVDLGYLLTEGHLARSVVNREFASNRQFLFAVIKALTVAKLQNLKEQLGPHTILERLTLPELHRKNLVRVLRYVTNPDYELPSR